MTQAWLPLNPNHAPNMSWDLALHTVISFLTNTNQQHYSGQAQLSYLSQMTGIVGLQVITPMMGLALVVATLRAFFYQRPSHIAADVAEQPDQILIGNYWADVIRPTVRFCFLSVLFGHCCLTAKACQQLFRVDRKYSLLIKRIQYKPKNSIRSSCTDGCC